MIEMEEFDDSDAENIIEEITFFPSIPARYIKRPKKKEESIETTLIFQNKN